MAGNFTLKCVGTLITRPYTAGGRSRRGSPKAGTTVLDYLMLKWLHLLDYLMLRWLHLLDYLMLRWLHLLDYVMLRWLPLLDYVMLRWLPLLDYLMLIWLPLVYYLMLRWLPLLDYLMYVCMYIYSSDMDIQKLYSDNENNYIRLKYPVQ